MSLIVMALTATISYAQTARYATSGAGRGGESYAKIYALVQQMRTKVNKQEQCANKGKLHSSVHGGDKDADECLNDFEINNGGGVAIDNGLSVSGSTSLGALSAGNISSGAITSSGNISGNDISGSNLSVSSQITVGGNVFAPAPSCISGQKLSWGGSSWQCVTENDPKVGSLSGSKWCTSDGSVINCTADAPAGSGMTMASTCGVNEKLRWTGSAWQCLTETDPVVSTLTTGKWCTTNGSVITCTAEPPANSGMLAAPTCGTTQKLRWTGTAWECIAEFDPRIGSVTAGKWCTSDGMNINCTSDIAAGESDPSVGTLTTGRWCTSDGAVINCDAAVPVLAESDPKVGSLTNGKWCTSDGSKIDCGADAPPTSAMTAAPSCLAEHKLRWTGSAWECIGETDPKVGTLTNGRWCTSNGSQISCTTLPPVLTETDPKVGSITNGKWCAASGGQVACTSDLTAPAPTANDHVANKEYVDTAIAGIAVGGAGGGGQYCRMTRSLYKGNLGGTSGADAKCASEFGSGWKMADPMQTLSSMGGTFSSVDPFLGAWVFSPTAVLVTDVPYAPCGGCGWYTFRTNNCVNWTDPGSGTDLYSQPSATYVDVSRTGTAVTLDGRVQSVGCGNELPIVCCN